jgi:hypothetical protein
MGEKPQSCAGLGGRTTDVPEARAWENLRMSTPTLREHVDEFGRRLDRIGAAARSLRETTAGIHDGHAGGLLDALEVIDRDLMLALHDLEELREHTSREIRSVSAAADHPDL